MLYVSGEYWNHLSEKGLNIRTSATVSTVDSDVDYASFVNSVEMPYGVSDTSAVTVPESFFTTNDGPRIYLLGGCVSDQSCSYGDDPAQGIFCVCMEITDKVMYFTPQTNTYHTDVAPMPVARYRHVAALEDNYIYVAGGRNVSDHIIEEIYRYDVFTNTWEFVCNWETGATSDLVAFTTPSDSLLYLVGGYTQTYDILGDMQVLDTTTGQFLPAGTYPSMSVARGDSQAASLYDRLYFVIGGWSNVDDDSFCFPLKVVEYYDVLLQQWFTTSSMHYGRGDLATGVLDNTVFAVGGEQKQTGDVTCTYSVPVKDVERYLNLNSDANDVNGTWLVEESIPANIFRFSGATYNSSSVVGGNSESSSAIYLFGGQGTFDADKNIFPIRNSTIIYYPQAIYGPKKKKAKLDAAGITGIVVAGVVVLACIVFGVISGLVYRYAYYQYKSLEDVDGEVVDDGKNNNFAVEMTGGSKFPDPVISGGSRFNNGSNNAAPFFVSVANTNANSVSVSSKVPNDEDLEIMEMQDNFPEHRL